MKSAASKVHKAEPLSRPDALFRGLGDTTFMNGVVLEEEDIAAFRGLLQKGFLFNQSSQREHIISHDIGQGKMSGRRQEVGHEYQGLPFVRQLWQHHGGRMPFD